MKGTVHRLIGRLVPTLLIAVGVMFLTAGLLSYVPSTLGQRPSAEPPAVADPRIEPTTEPTLRPSAEPSPEALSTTTQRNPGQSSRSPASDSRQSIVIPGVR